MSENIVKKDKPKAKKISHSKLNVYDSCAWKYYLTYEENHFIFTDNISSELGTLLHAVEEKIFNLIKENNPIPYQELIDFFQNANLPKRNKFDTENGIFGLNILKEKYKEEFYKTDELGRSYYSKTSDYIEYGIHRLEDYFKDNPNIKPFEAEKYFSFTYRGYILSGFIDRIFYDTEKDIYIIEDIKTKGKPFKDEELVTPMQFVIYCMGLHECLDIPYEKIICRYNLPFLNITQDAGTKGFIKRGTEKLDKIIDKIESKEWKPNPSPLCYWCQYSQTNPDQPEEGKNLCPYYSLWTPDKKNKGVENKWEGMDQHAKILQKFLQKNGKIQVKKIVDDFDFDF